MNPPPRPCRSPPDATRASILVLKTVELSSSKRILYPHLTYCYLSIEASLQSLLLRPSFVAECSKWKTRELKSGVLQDIYDGRLWKEFQVYNGVPFLSEPHNFAFNINLDWFQPFKHSTYSIGAIYMTVMNCLGWGQAWCHWNLGPYGRPPCPLALQWALWSDL